MTTTVSKPAAMTAELPKLYTPAEAEPVVRAKWDAAQAFHADPNADGEPFCILIPPPNVTAALHLGHAFNNTLQDILVRYHRMRGYNTLWMPGTDHAGIGTQAVVEKRLLMQGKRRTDFTREQFIAKVQAWKDEYEATIIEQLKLMGCSCDFARTRFTMDEVCSRAVREAFFRLFKDGLIYRGKRLVNWDPVTQTALADDEVEMEEVQGFMYYLRYPVESDEASRRGDRRSDEGAYVTVATTRPETMLGDTAVAMNPKDPRAAQFVGRKVRLPIVDRVIPIIADDYVVMPAQFGGDENDAKAKIATGFLKVTPAHDDNDYLIGQRHPEIGMVNVFAPDASISDKHGWTEISEEAKQFLGLSREDARKKVVQWFKDHGLFEDAKPYTHSVGHSYRSHVPIEPYLSDQWYVRVTDDRVKGEALRAMAAEQRESGNNNGGEIGGTGILPVPPASGTTRLGDGELRFCPARYAKTFQSWHENLRDWCISRQLWWGHRIPVWTIGLENMPKNYIQEHGDSRRAWDTFRNDFERMLVEFLQCGGVAAEDVAIQPHTMTALRISVRSQRGVDLLNSFERYFESLRFKPYAPGELRGEILAHPPGFSNTKDAAARLRRNVLSIKQDPDVLDTWFSSALWPLSTMGWPEPEAFPNEIPEGSALLKTFNPSSVLCTAREIITLWVSRMVMFNRYLREGVLPFKDVYIHAMIQDGHGQKMSKSLGNGVDPRDIVHSHGADGMRFTLAKIATATQDVRLPVDMICPNPQCGETFQPKEITTSSGYRVAAPMQECPKCKRPMVSSYGAATGAAEPTGDMPLARNSSRKFDEGRNFANKLWNATRFALSNLSTDKAQGLPSLGFTDPQNLSLVDKWITARLHRTLHAVEEALADYQFNAYADAMYDFIWRDFCDWYLEAIKHTVKSNPAQQQALRTVLNASLRLLHPIMPFVTETLWPSVIACGFAGLDGIALEENDLCATAPWPDIKCTVDDQAAVASFERIQNLVNAIRTLRSERNVPPKEMIRLSAAREVVDLINSAGGVVESLAKVEAVEVITAGATPQAAVPLAFEGGELLLAGLVEQVDLASEKARLTKMIAEKAKAVAGFRNKLSNEGYLSKAPPEKVDETRRLMAQAEADLAAACKALESVG